MPPAINLRRFAAQIARYRWNNSLAGRGISSAPLRGNEERTLGYRQWLICLTLKALHYGDTPLAFVIRRLPPPSTAERILEPLLRRAQAKLAAYR